MGVDNIAELVGHDQCPAPLLGRSDIKQEGPAVGVRSSSSVPILVGAAPEPLVLGGEALQYRVDDLLLGGTERDSDLTTLIGEDLWAQHAGIGDSDQSVCRTIRLCDDEEPWTVGATVNVRLLDCRVDLLLVLREHDVVEFAGRGQTLYDVFHLVTVDAPMQVECQGTDLGVGEEQRLHPPLSKVVGYRDVVREIAVVDQSAVDSLTEGVSPPWVRHPASSRVAVVADPDMGGHSLESVVADYILGVADYLEDQYVASMAQHECVSASILGVELDIQCMGGVEDELLGSRLSVVRVDDVVEFVCDEPVQLLLSRPDEVAYYVRWSGFKRGQITLPSRQFRHLVDMIDMEVGMNAGLFDRITVACIEVSHCIEI